MGDGAGWKPGACRRGRVGIVGGFGPPATADLYLAVARRLRAEGIPADIVVWHVPISLHDEHQGMTVHSWPGLAPILARGVEALEGLSCDVVGIPCSTAHQHFGWLSSRFSVRLVDMVSETVREAAGLGVCRCGILGTEACLEAGLYQSALEQAGLACVEPNPAGQASVSRVIEAALAGPLERSLRLQLCGVVDQMAAAGADAIVVACTDLSHVLSAPPQAVPMIDALSALSDALVEAVSAADGGGCP